MKTLEQIKKDLEYIRTYYRNKSWIKDPSKVIHPADFAHTYEAYHSTITDMPPQLRQVFNAFYVSGTPKSKIALSLGVTERYISIMTGKIESFLCEKPN